MSNDDKYRYLMPQPEKESIEEWLERIKERTKEKTEEEIMEELMERSYEALELIDIRLKEIQQTLYKTMLKAKTKEDTGRLFIKSKYVLNRLKEIDLMMHDKKEEEK